MLFAVSSLLSVLYHGTLPAILYEAGNIAGIRSPIADVENRSHSNIKPLPVHKNRAKQDVYE